MPMGLQVFQDFTTFEQAFRHKLNAILAQQTLGAFILACANASAQQGLLTAMAPAIDEQYRQLQGLFRNRQAGSASAEDRSVFEALLALGLENLPATERRRLGPWSVQYNTMRGFRPMRHASETPSVLQIPFDPNGFSFNQAFMLKELFWQGELAGHQLAAYYNKFPFADYHLLWVPDRQLGQSQYLTQAYHQLCWQLLQQLTPALPGFAVGYSAMGACASVNHLHFQSYVGEPLAVADGCWHHNGGTESYPLAVFVFHQAEEAWRLIEQLHQQNQPYNLLYTETAIYCVPRQRQGSIGLPEWSPGFAWREVFGEMICLQQESYLSLSRQQIEDTLAQWRVDI